MLMVTSCWKLDVFLSNYVPRQSVMADERSVVTATAFRKIPLETAGTYRAFCAGISLAVRFHEAYEYVRPLDLAVDYMQL